LLKDNLPNGTIKNELCTLLKYLKSNSHELVSA